MSFMIPVVAQFDCVFRGFRRAISLESGRRFRCKAAPSCEGFSRAPLRLRRSPNYPMGQGGMRASTIAVVGVAANGPLAVAPAPRRPKLLDRLREALRSRHYSGRTEQAYCLWVKRFITFHHLRHPAEMVEREINAFLAHLAIEESHASW
jgi:hypothetical protein